MYNINHTIMKFSTISNISIQVRTIPNTIPNKLVLFSINPHLKKIIRIVSIVTY